MSRNQIMSYNQLQRKYALDIKDHELDDSQYNEYTDEIKNILTGKKMVYLSHTDEKAKWYDKVNRLLDLQKQVGYHRRQNTFKRVLHWGQLKLFLSEVEFLNKVLSDKKRDLSRKVVMVYAGAAPGHHIAYLHSLFPEVEFQLYDPNKFVVKDAATLKTHQQFFTDADALYWKEQVQQNNLHLVFCSDIRTEPATQENIIRNMNMQLDWWKIMEPELSMFKFRLPWEAGETEYPEGEIYIQAYPGPTSSETRLIVEKNAKIIKYNNKQYEDACFYHNTVSRDLCYNTKLGKLSLERDGLDNCYDCASFIKIMEEYVNYRKLPLTKIRSLIGDIQKEISFGKSSVKLHTVKWFNTTFDKFKKLTYKRCKDDKCTKCQNAVEIVDPTARGLSVATIENEEKAIESAKKKKQKDE